MFIVDGICILLNVVIADLNPADLVLQVSFSPRVVTTITTQTKVVSYCELYPKDDFIPLAVEIFKCVHQ